MITDKSGQGYAQLAADGLFRTFDTNGEVLDYVQLSPEQITDVASNLSQDHRNAYAGINGHDVVGDA
jgi:hypothetical protein